MGPDGSILEQTITRVRRRHLARLAAHRCGGALAVAGAAAVVLLMVDRLLGLGLPWPGYAAIAAAGLLVGLLRTARSAPAREAVAVDLDRRLGLADRLGSALALRGTPAGHADPSFAALVRHDAEGRAARIDPRATVSVRVPRSWIVVAALTAVWIAAARLLPARILPERRDAAAAETTPSVEQIEARAEAAQLLDTATTPLRGQAEEDPVVEEQLEALDELARQLEGTPTRPVEEIREESAARLDELAERLEGEAERDLDATEELVRRFESIPEPEAPMPSDELMDAIRRGEFGDAADVLEQLLERAEDLSATEREQLADALRELGAQARDLPPTDAEDLAESRARLEQALRDQGLDDQSVRELLDGEAADEQQVERELTERGVDPDVARDLARDLQAMSDREDAREQAQRRAEEVGDAMEEAARRVESPDEGREPPDAPQTPDGQRTPDGERTPDGQQTPDAQRQPDGQQTPDAQRTPDGQQTPDGQRTPDAQRIPDAQRTPDGQQTPDGQRTPDGQQTPDAQRTPDGQQTPDAQRQAGAEQTPDGQRPPDGQQTSDGQRPPDAPPTPQDGAAEATPEALPQPGAEQGAPGEERPGGEPAGRRDPQDALRRIEREREQAQEALRRSESLRDAARRMAEGMDEQQRRRWQEQWSRQLGQEREPGTATADTPRGDAEPWRPEEVEDVDLRGDGDEERIAARWLTDEQATDAPLEGAERRSRIVRDARQVAERAVNESAVPSRYHRLIKRYFERLQETVDRSADAPADPD